MPQLTIDLRTITSASARAEPIRVRLLRIPDVNDPEGLETPGAITLLDGTVATYDREVVTDDNGQATLDLIANDDLYSPSVYEASFAGRTARFFVPQAGGDLHELIRNTAGATATPTIPSGGTGGLSQSQVDARVRAGVKDYAEEGNTSAKIPTSDIADDAITLDKISTTGATDGQVLVVDASGDPVWRSQQQVSGGGLNQSEVDARVSAGIASGVKSYAQAGGRTITGNDLAADTITGTQIADDAVDTDQIADGAVTTAGVEDDAITGAKVAANAITTDLVADNTITSAKIAPGAVGESDIADLAVSGDKLKDLAVSTGKIADDAITGAKIADDAVGPDQIDGSGGSAGQVLKRQADGSVAWAEDATASGGSGLDEAAVDARVRAGVKDYAETGSTTLIATADIADEAITTDKLVRNAITGDRLAPATIARGRLQQEIITANYLASDAVTQEKIADGAVGTDQIAANSITTGLIATGAVQHTDIAAGAVGEVSISTGAVTTDKIANGAVTAAKLASDVSLGGGGAPTGYAYDYIGSAESGGHQSSATYTPTSTNLRVHTAGGTAAAPDKISLPLPSSPNLNQGVTDPENFWAFYGLRDYLGYMGEGALVKLGDTTYRLTGNETERSVTGYTIFEYAVEVAEGTAALPVANEDVAIEVFAFPRPGAEAPADLNRFVPGTFVLRGSERNGPGVPAADHPAELVNQGSPRNMVQVVRGPEIGGLRHVRTTYAANSWTTERIDGSALVDGDLPISKISHSGGTAAQVLAINSSGSGVEWVDAAEGGEAAVLIDGSDSDVLASIRFPRNYTFSTSSSNFDAIVENRGWGVTAEGTAAGLRALDVDGSDFDVTYNLAIPATPADGQIGWWVQIFNDTTQNSDEDLFSEAFVPFGVGSPSATTLRIPGRAVQGGNFERSVRILVDAAGIVAPGQMFVVAGRAGFTTDLPFRVKIRAATLSIEGVLQSGGTDTTAVARGHATGDSKTNVDDLPLGVVVFPGGRNDVIPAGMPPACDENGGTLYTIPEVQQTFTSFNGKKVIARTWLGSAWGHWVDITAYPAAATRYTDPLVPDGLTLFGASCPDFAWKLPRLAGSPWSERNMDDYRLVLTLARPSTEARLGESSAPSFYLAPTHGIHTRPSANWSGARADGADRTVAHQNLKWKEVYGNGIVDTDGYALKVERTGSAHPELHGVIGFKDSNPNFHHLATFENGLAMDSSAEASNRAFQEFTGLASDALTGHFSRASGLLVLAETAHRGDADSYADYLAQLTRNANEVFFTNRVDAANAALRFTAGLQPTSSEPFFLLNKWRDGNSSTEHGIAIHRNSHVNKYFLLHLTRDRNAEGGAQKWVPDNSFSEDYWGFKSISRLDIPNLVPTGTHRINTESASPWIELPDSVAHATKLLFLVDYDPAAAEYAMTGIQDNFILSRRGKSWTRNGMGAYAAGFHNNADADAASRYRVSFRKNASEVKVWTQNGSSFYTYGIYILEEEGE